MGSTGERSCPALLLSAPASGQGKTTVAAGLARAWCRRGLRVCAFKTGPDFIDPGFLEAATGEPVHALDLWMGGGEDCRRRLHAAAGEADLILVEGVMGLFDGDPSSADLASAFGLPVAAVIDAAAMAQTFGALVHGLDRYRSDLRLAGVFANNTGSAGHGEFLARAMPADVPFWGALQRDDAVRLPERHLGLVTAAEQPGIEAWLERLADRLEPLLPPEPPHGRFPAPAGPPAGATACRLDGRRIGVARDAAFCFVYRANLELLEALGAELVPFSPLADEAPPAVDAIYLPGGYPELHARELGANAGMVAGLRAHAGAGRPVVAECGGMLYLLETLQPLDDEPVAQAALLPGAGVMQPRLTAIGMQSAELPGGTLRGHTFHHARLDGAPEPAGRAANPRGRGASEALYRDGAVTASFVHWYFPSNPEAAARLFLA